MDTRVNYGGSMDTLHGTKMEYTTKRLHTRKNMTTVFYSIVFRGRHSWRNRNRRMLEEGSQFHFNSATYITEANNHFFKHFFKMEAVLQYALGPDYQLLVMLRIKPFDFGIRQTCHQHERKNGKGN